MFVGYTERVAYGQDEDQPVEDAIDGNVNTSIASDHDVPRIKPFGGYKLRPDTGDDFIFIGECSETFGPSHLMTIPEKCPMEINLNTLAVRILASDYQGLGVGSQIPNNDTSLLICDAMADVHILVNYFVMFDSQARGFVRPVCVAFVTSDKYKLLKCLKLLKKALSQATASIKLSNRKMCILELENLIQDLKFTQNELPSEENLKSKAKVELIDNALRDIHNMAENINCLQVNDEVQETIKRFQDHLKCWDLTGGVKQFLTDANLKSSFHQPKVVKVPLRQNFDKELRPLALISPGGFLLGLYQLLVTYKYFRRKYENLCLQKDKNNSDGCLYFGACLKSTQDQICITKEAQEKPCFNFQLLSDIPKFLEIEEECDFKYAQSDFLALLPQLTERELPVPLSSNVVNKSLNISVTMPLSSIHHQEAPASLELSEEKRHNRISEPRFKKSSITDCHWHGETLQKIWDIIEVFQAQDKERLFTKTLQASSHVKSILYSLLIGNLCVVIGEAHQEPDVRAMVRGLSIFVPRARGKIVLAEEWRSASVSKDEQSSLSVLGFCETSKTKPVSSTVNVTVINLKNKSYKGPQYTGILLSDLDKRIKYVVDNGGHAFTIIISILADIELKVQLWQLLSTSKNGIRKLKNYLEKKEYSSYDIFLIEKLANLTGSIFH